MNIPDSAVRVVTFPITDGARPGEYEIFVSFDTPGETPAPGTRAHRKKG